MILSVPFKKGVDVLTNITYASGTETNVPLSILKDGFPEKISVRQLQKRSYNRFFTAPTF